MKLVTRGIPIQAYRIEARHFRKLKKQSLNASSAIEEIESSKYIDQTHLLVFIAQTLSNQSTVPVHWTRVTFLWDEAAERPPHISADSSPPCI